MEPHLKHVPRLPLAFCFCCCVT